MEENRFEYLFKKYLQRNLNDAEQVEFYKLVIAQKNDDSIKLLLDNLYATEDFASIKEIIDEKRVLSQILNKQKPKIVKLHTLKSKWIRVAIAACAVLVVSMFLKSYLNKRDVQLSEFAAKQILPATDQASLHLSNGDLLLLDTMKTGSTKLVDGMKIVKTNNGEVIYEAMPGSETSGVNEFVTPRGGKYTLILPDRTKVWLNAATTLKYPKQFSNKERVVELSGEAYFEVSKVKDQPFIVKSGTQFVEVLGTHFNFNTYADNNFVTTTLLEGSVKAGNQLYSQIIKPGEKAEYSGNTAVKVSKADIESIMAWKNGEFIFKEKTLDLVMKEVARWYDVEVSFDPGFDPQQVKLVGWVSRKKDLSAIIKNLETATGLTFNVKERRIDITK